MTTVAALLFVFLATAAFGAEATNDMDIVMDVQEITLVNFTVPDAIDLALTSPTAAGALPTNDTTHTTVRLIYTTTVPTGQTRRVQVSFDSLGNHPPAGTELRVLANPVPANTGTSAGTVVISDAAQDFVVDIGSCRTGTAANSGPRIRYTFALVDPAALAIESPTVTVIYTFTAAS